jgi:hypothetical protein
MEFGGKADEGNRTPNLLITNQPLYQLSYVSRTGYPEPYTKSKLR